MEKNSSAINRFYKDFDAFENASHQYEKGEIDAGEYTGISKGFGDYLQRDNHQMLRIRVPGGRMTADMASAILDACTYYGVDTLKISTGQALQLHDLNPHAGRRLVLRLLDKGIVTRGSGGDNPNNITATPLSGLATEEYFDVQPYAKAADDYLLRYIGVRPLPRKFKIGFASFPSGEMHITMK
ncbi:MAG: nitrite/sulfite reductase, partial [Bilifractor sp.]|nr:nitrite/sulfite reductase [Bilifractor sp.]